MPFTEQERELLMQSAYGDPRLPHWLERMLEEGPGEYAWPPEPGYYPDDQIPLHEHVWNQIWHQGTIYPATFVAAPVLCEVIRKWPEISHAPLLANLAEAEYSRFTQPALSSGIPAQIVERYDAALQSLVEVMPQQIRMVDEQGEEGTYVVLLLLRLLSHILGKHRTAECLREYVG